MARFASRITSVLALLGLVVLSAGPVRGDQPDRTFTYTIDAEGDVAHPLSQFRHDVRRIFADMRAANLGGSIRFQPVEGESDLDIVLASPAVIEQSAAVCDAEFSCRVGDDVLINDENWRNGTPDFDGPLDTYRRYLLNHEIGHRLGLDHRECPGGGPAPLMMQQSKGTEACTPNGFPLPAERRRIGEVQGVRVLDPIPQVVQRPPVVPLSAGDGYWLSDELGDVDAFGVAPDLGSVRDFYSLDTGVVAAAKKQREQGGGYYLSAFGGELYAFDTSGRDADAEVGSTSGVRLAAPVVGMAADPHGRGYWLVASDGGVFSFGADFHGSAGGLDLAAPVVGMAPTSEGSGYWLNGADGGVFTYGDAPFHVAAR